MTREEAIEAIERVIHTELKWPGTEETVEALEMAVDALRAQIEREKDNDPLTPDELREMEQGEWLWIESTAGAAYYQTQYDYTNGEAFCFGYPGIGHALDYCDYGKTWLAYRRKPEGKAT